MRYRIFHSTVFKYGDPITESVMEIRMQPRTDGLQNCVQFDLHLKPSAQISDFRDFHGNVTHHFDIPAKHTQLEIKTESIVEVSPAAVLPEALTPEIWEEIDRLTFDENFWEFTHESFFAKPTGKLLELAEELDLGREKDPLTLLKEINTSLHEKFKYAQDATSVDSPIDEALEKRGGVCQDFSNIMIALARHLKIPCRYVSGYLFHRTDDRSHIAQDATHAWVEAYLPTLGWVGFDPTNNLICAERHIRVAIGRDYADVPPTRGIFKGVAETELSVAVSVSQVDSSEFQTRMEITDKPKHLIAPKPKNAYDYDQQQQQQQ